LRSDFSIVRSQIGETSDFKNGENGARGMQNGGMYSPILKKKEKKWMSDLKKISKQKMSDLRKK
jgi:hypothetical protein